MNPARSAGRGGFVPAFALLALAGAGLAALIATTSLDFRLDAFLPAPSDPAQALIADRLGDSPGARSVLVALGGAEAEALATSSRRMAAELDGSPGILRVDNGSDPESLDPDAPLFKHRFVLTEDPARRTRPDAIAESLEARLADLGLAGSRAREWIARDPLGLTAELLEELSPARAPETFEGVWFATTDEGGETALLIVQTNYPAFDVEAQEIVIDAIKEAFDEAAREHPGLELERLGPPAFAVDSARQARRDAGVLSAAATVWVLLLLGLAWRRPTLVVAGAVPLALAVLAGLAAVSGGFGWVHGLTLAFGFTLLGVAMDYPVHLFSHVRSRGDNAARAVAWPLALGAASTLVAYGTIWLSGSPGLAQLGAFSAVGLAVAACVTLLLLPRLGLPPPAPPPRAISLVLRAPRVPWLAPVLLVAGLGAGAWLGQDLWSDDVSRLGPVDAAAMDRDGELRGQLGAGEVSHLLVVTGDTRDGAVEATESLTGHLETAREQGLLSGWQSADRLVPSRETAERRTAAWPNRETMEERLAEAAGQAGFRSDAFEPFLDDLEAAVGLEPPGPETWADTPLAGLAGGLLEPAGQGWRSLVIPEGVNDPKALAEFLDTAGSPGQWVDLQAVSNSLVADYRRDVLLSLAIALGLVVALLAFRMRRLGGLVAVLSPPLAAVALTATGLAVASGGLTIVHLMALILVAGIGLDYTLFLQRFSHQPDPARRTLWAIGICAASTGGVFAILSTSGIAMLSQLGTTAAVGIALVLVLAVLGRRPCSTTAG